MIFHRVFLVLAALVVSVAVGQEIDFGDDTGEWANDGVCDDPRFRGPSALNPDGATLPDERPMTDATDCRLLFERGEVWLVQDIDFGDDTSEWANDGECDDPRFDGFGASLTRLWQDELHDASDCRQLFERGEVWLTEGPPERFGALAVGTEGRFQSYRSAYGRRSQKEADRAALARCRFDGGLSAAACEIVARFGPDECLAIAEIERVFRGPIGWAVGTYVIDTDMNAEEQCRQANPDLINEGANCWVEEFVCN